MSTKPRVIITSGARRSKPRKYTRDTGEYTIFALVILLAATLYAHQAQLLTKQQTILKIIGFAAVLLFAMVFLRTLKRYILHNRTAALAHTLIDNMSGTEFERYVANLLPAQGYKNIQLTEHYDFGIDIIAEKEGIIWGIQVKRHSSPVTMSAVRQVVAALNHYDCNRAMVITNSTFSTSAQDLAATNDCILIDRQQLAKWARVRV